MASAKHLYEQHREILRLASDLKSLLAGTTPPSQADLARARWLLSSALMRHLTEEDQILHAALSDSPEPKDQALLGRYDGNHYDIRTAYFAHNQRWPGDSAQQSWREFNRDLEGLFALITDCVQWEERHLYPHVTRIEMQMHRRGAA